MKATTLSNISQYKLFIVLMKVAGALVSPMGITNHSLCPYLVEKAVLGTDSSAILHYQYPLLRSKLEKYFAPANWSVRSSWLGRGYLSLMVTAFRAL